MRACLQQPLRLDLGGRPRKELRGLDELERHQPRGRLSRERRRGMNGKTSLLGADVDPLIGPVIAYLRQESRDQRAVQRVLSALATLRHLEPQIAENVLELAMDLAPFSNT